MKNTVRINFEFPRSEYPSLKILCARLGASLKDFATGVLMKAIEDAEDNLLAHQADQVLERIESGKEKTIPLEHVKKQVLTSESSSRNIRKRKKTSRQAS